MLSHLRIGVVALSLLYTFSLTAPGKVLAGTAEASVPLWHKPSLQLHDALGQAETLAEKGNYAGAEKVLAAFAAAHTSEQHPLLSYELGYFCYRQEKLEQSLIYLQKTVKSAAGYGDAWQLLAMAWQEKGNTLPQDDTERKEQRQDAMINAARAMEKAAVLNADNDLKYQAAMLWLAGEKAQKALTILRPLSELKSAKEEWLVGLSEIMQALQRGEETAEAMEKAARLQNDPNLCFHAAWLWNELEKPERALSLLKPLADRVNPDKNWLLLLVSVYNSLKRPADAALTMEQVIIMDPAAEYLFNCGLLWLQSEMPDKALRSLLRLADIEPAKADWFVAIAQAWLLQENLERAADAMEKAASLSGDPDHRYRAGTLRLQLKQADRALGLLAPLADLKRPKSDWLVALANGWLLKENYHKGAIYMEKAAFISGQGKLFHRAAMLWHVDGNLEKTLNLLKRSVRVKEVEQLWLIDLASVLFELNRVEEIPEVMARTTLEDKRLSGQLRYRGAMIWLNLQKPEKAYPVLKELSQEREKRYPWLTSFVKTCVELEHMDEAEDTLDVLIRQYPAEVKTWKLAVWLALQRSDYKKAVAAEEILRRFEPKDTKHLEDLSRLYLLAGIPRKSADLYKKTVKDATTPEALRHVLDIYLSGQHYELALEVARQLVHLEDGRQRISDYEMLGDIYFALHRYEKSCEAYEEITRSEDNANSSLKAGYAAMKAGQLARAVVHYERAIAAGGNNSSLVESASENLAYVKRQLKEREEVLQLQRRKRSSMAPFSGR